MKPYSVFDIAKYFLLKAEEQGQELLSNMKLQKLVYYAQGLHLVEYDEEPLFSERIEAWQFGPVIPVLYRAYRKHGTSGIPANKTFKPETIDEETRDFLDEIYDFFGQFSAIRLMELSHSDECWTNAYPGKEISPEAMRKCLKKYLAE